MKKLIKITLLLFLAFPISIISLLPPSLELNANFTNNDNVNVGTLDSARLQEAKMNLQLENAKLTRDVQDAQDDARKYAMIGIFASGIFFIFGYVLSKRDLKSTIDDTVKRTVEKMVEMENAKRSVTVKGKPVIRTDESNTQKNVAQNMQEVKVDTNLVNASDTKQDETKDYKSDHEKNNDLSKGVKL